MERASKQPETGAGYLCFQSTEGGAEWAALLVVTPAGLPQEFLYSGPLRPTPVQTILYQERLEEQVRLSLIRSLLRGLRSRLAFAAVREGDLGPAWVGEISAPVLVVRGDEARWLVAPDPASEAMREHLERGAGAVEPLGRAIAALAYVVAYEAKRHDGE